MSLEKVKKYLMSKGYKYDSIALAIDNLNEMTDNNQRENYYYIQNKMQPIYIFGMCPQSSQNQIG